MKALILAAGVGTRFSRRLSELPKCCALVGDRPLIRHTFNVLRSLGVNDIGLVTGYKDAELLRHLDGLPFSTFRNPFFRVTNSIASMWFALPFLAGHEDVLILNADLYIEEEAVERLLACEHSPVFLADSSRIEAADYRFNWHDRRLLKSGKDLTDSETTGEYVGIAKVRAEHIHRINERLSLLIHQGQYDMWWEDALYSFINDDTLPLFVEDISVLFWAELDFVEDYYRVQEHVTACHNP